ncbi:MAG: hypothetical protein H3C43_08770, partial [Leptonema sp. (in: Bacteria)]|nr:hypothetical protein [Leptonema sp. (in: bacteria)]
MDAETYVHPRGDRNVNDVSRNVKVDLQLSKTVYSEDEPISVTFKISNQGHRTVRLYPFSPESRSFQFEVLDKNGKELSSDETKFYDENDDVLENNIVDLAGDRVREIQLQPGESFERRIFLDRHYRLNPGQYRVSGFFLPDARHDILLRTVNRLELRIEKKKSRFLFEERDDTLTTAAGPDAEETVYLFLSAEMLGKTDRYLKYIDLRKYILSYDMFARQYVRASKQKQEEVLQRFADYLKSGPVDPLRRFRIIKSTSETDTRYRVDVIALRSSGNYRVEYLYNYYLDKDQAGAWRISSVVAGIQ